jgi:hypothetical protein
MGEPARPPPGKCLLVVETLRANNVSDLHQLLAEHESAFDILLLHAQACEVCRTLVEQSFPDGLASPSVEELLDERVADLSAETSQAPLADVPAQDPSKGETGT